MAERLAACSLSARLSAVLVLHSRHTLTGTLAKRSNRIARTKREQWRACLHRVRPGMLRGQVHQHLQQRQFPYALGKVQLQWNGQCQPRRRRLQQPHRA